MRSIFSAILAISFFGGPAWAKTRYSALLDRVQNTYLKNAAAYPIVIMDRDELEWSFVKAGATGEKDSARRASIVKDYIQKKTGVTISENAAENFDIYLTLVKDSANALPALDDSQKIQMCAVFPPDPNRNRRMETERLLQLQAKDAYGHHDYSELLQTLSYDDYVLFSILHESGHCMDRYFFPELFAGDDDPSTIHQAESYAETMGALLMAKDGHTNVVPARAYLRDIYSYYMEPFFIAHPENGVANPAYPYGGLIYHLSPSLRAAEGEIANHLDQVKSDSMTALQDLADRLVVTNAYSTPMFTAIYMTYSDGREAALKQYEAYAKDTPDIFAPVLMGLHNYINEEDRFKASAFETGPFSAPYVPLHPFDGVKACELLKSGDYDGLRTMIDGLRMELEQSNPSPADEDARFQLLSNLWNTLPGECANGGTRLQLSHVTRANRAEVASSMVSDCSLASSLRRISRTQ